MTEETQLFKDLRQIDSDIRSLAAALAVAIQFSCPVTDHYQKKLVLCQKICKKLLKDKEQKCE